ncbi:MAG: 2-dehydropantoate 2-reductase [Lachnospiraceae bacterium]|nr:2-dehydropantoate 2-reductase [Lachnospiraceae bacterium]
MSIKNVTIIGMGALGTMFGTVIQHKIGIENVSFLMDEARYQKNISRPYFANGAPADFRLITPKNASPADLIIVSIKATGLEEALVTLESSVGPDTIIISAVNGIRSEEVLIDKFGPGHVIHAVAQGMDATFFDHRLTYSQTGCFCLGIIDPSMQEKLDSLTAFFDGIGFSYVVEKNIRHRIWSKFMLNVGINQSCMIFATGYGGGIAPASEARMVMISAMREAMLVANAEGVNLTESDLAGYVGLMESLTPESMPSMAQDRINGKLSEVEEFAGTVIRLAMRHKILVPTNEFLYRKIMEIETEYPELP